MARADHLALIASMVRAEGTSLTDEDWIRALGVAVVRYSKDRPRALVADVVSPGGVVLDPPTGWVGGQSQVILLETPIDAVPPVVIGPSGMTVEEVPSVEGNRWRIRLFRALAVGAAVRVRWTAPHTVDEVIDTVPMVDQEAVAAYAAAHVLEGLAAEKSADIDPSISAADVRQASIAGEYAKRAKDLRTRYYTALSLDSERIAPAGAVVAVSRPASSGLGRLTHGWGRGRL